MEGRIFSNRLTTPYSVTVSSSLSFHHLKLHILVKGHTEIFKEICMERRRARCTLSEEQGELLEWVCRKKYFWQVSKLAWQWCNNLPQRTNVTKSSVSLGRERVWAVKIHGSMVKKRFLNHYVVCVARTRGSIYFVDLLYIVSRGLEVLYCVYCVFFNIISLS